MGRRTLLLIASILVAALGTSLIWLYVQGADTRAQADTALEPVLFAAGPAAAGTPAEKVSVVSQLVPAGVAALGVRNLQQVAGKQLVNGATQNQMLVPTMFAATSQTGIAKGDAFVSITISDPHRVPALLKPGDPVAIYALAGKQQKACLQTVMDSAIVKTLGGSTAQGPNGSVVPLTIVGFEVPVEKAVELMKIETYGEPVLALLGDNTKGATATCAGGSAGG